MEINDQAQSPQEEFSFDLFNVSQENDETGIQLDEEFVSMNEMPTRRC